MLQAESVCVFLVRLPSESSLDEELEKLRLNPELHMVNPDDLEELGTIGDGNFSTVHKMRNKKLGKNIAVKVCEL